jgi:hypothetical protein
MKRSALALVVLALLAAVGMSLPSQAQTQNQPPSPARSRSDEMLDRWNDIGNKLIAMAQDFPEDKYDSPQANAFCEQLVGTIRRECLDFMIPLNARHLRGLLRESVRHYNSGRPHSSLGPGIPEEAYRGAPRRGTTGQTRQKKTRVISRPTLGGLHHEYAWKEMAG